MRKLNILALAVVVALAAAPAFASVQNVRISGDVDSTYLFRENFDLGNSATNDQQSVFFTQTRLRVDADLTDQVAATVALINERVWNSDGGTDTGANTESDTNVSLYLAYVTLREMLYSPLTVIVGRQDFRYGNSFIFDSAGTNNSAPGDSGLDGVAEDLTKQTALDAIRFILDYNPLTIEAFYAAVNQGTVSLADDDDNINVWGLVATYEVGDAMNSIVEAYIFDKKDKSEVAGSVDNQTNHIKVLGGRFSTNPLEGLNLQAELAHQSGTNVTTDEQQDRDAWGFQGIANYQLPVLEEYNPTLMYVFTKVYGNHQSTSNPDDAYTAWDPFFENQAGGTIYNTLFNLSNAVIHTLSLSVNPMEDVKTKFSVTKLWTEGELSAGSIGLVQPDGGSASPAGPGNRELGIELGVDTTYNYTEDVQLGLNVGVFKPSDAFDSDVDAKQVIAHVNVAF